MTIGSVIFIILGITLVIVSDSIGNAYCEYTNQEALRCVRLVLALLGIGIIMVLIGIIGLFM